MDLPLQGNAGATTACVAATSSHYYLEVDSRIPAVLGWDGSDPSSPGLMQEDLRVKPPPERRISATSGAVMLIWSLPYLAKLNQVNHSNDGVLADPIGGRTAACGAHVAT